MSNRSKQEAARKRRKRAAERAAGLITVSVLVAEEYADAVRQYASTLPRPGPASLPGQLDIFDTFDEMSESGEV